MKNNLVKQNPFYSFVTNGDKYKKKKFSYLSKFLIALFLITIVVISFWLVGFNLSPNGVTVFSNRVNKVFLFSNTLKDYPNYSLVSLSLEYLWISIKGTIVGTTIGFIVAFITATFSNYYLIRNLFLANSMKVFIVLLRAFPTVVFIYFFTNLFSKDLSLVLVLFWFSWIWLHKYMIEIYNNLNYYPFFNLVIQGNSKILAYLKTIIPQINNKFISLFLYSFDANMRWSSLLGTLGLAGIGELIEKASNQFEAMGIPVLTIMIFMILLECFVFVLNRYLLVHQSSGFSEQTMEFIKSKNKTKLLSFAFIKKNRKELANYYMLKTYLKACLFIFFFAILIYSLITLKWSSSSVYQNNFFQQLFEPDWSIVYQKNINIWIDVFKMVGQSIVIITITLVLSLILLFISCFKLFKYYSILGIFLSTIIRSIPMIALFFLINPLFANPSSTICIVLAIASATVINKNITESINKIDAKLITAFTMQGFNNFTIFIKYIIPSVKKDFLTFFSFEWEGTFRDLITYGKYGVSVIGSNVYIYFNGSKKQIDKMAAFVWISFFITLFAIFLTYLFRYFFVDNRNFFKDLNNFKFNLISKFKNLKKFIHKI
ncbi:MAG: hypothetical protein K2O19_02695 [Malacoplasma sp.]|nr:hypothetical protein [Malacoplasma sp.]